mmetsp:Transcript_126588/g.300690  ORF Transcript_126588/g.300690 Transcript_126588/m.300690 type:complete len:300 (-) Transcript_126588:822-1721(-)
MVRHFYHAIGDRTENPVRDGWIKTFEQRLYDVRPIGVHAQLDDVVLDGIHELQLLFLELKQQNQRLQGVGAALVAGDGHHLGPQLLEHPLPLPLGASLEGSATQIVPIRIAHHVRDLVLDFFEDHIHGSACSFDKLPLEIFAARLGSRHLRDLAGELLYLHGIPLAALALRRLAVSLDAFVLLPLLQRGRPVMRPRSGCGAREGRSTSALQELGLAVDVPAQGLHGRIHRAHSPALRQGCSSSRCTPLLIGLIVGHGRKVLRAHVPGQRSQQAIGRLARPSPVAHADICARSWRRERRR